jgi:hypothetical protein
MGSDQLAARVRASRPQIKVIFMSGDAASSPAGDGFAPKPIDLDALGDAITRALPNGTSHAASTLGRVYSRLFVTWALHSPFRCFYRSRLREIMQQVLDHDRAFADRSGNAF